MWTWFDSVSSLLMAVEIPSHMSSETCVSGAFMAVIVSGSPSEWTDDGEDGPSVLVEFVCPAEYACVTSVDCVGSVCTCVCSVVMLGVDIVCTVVDRIEVSGSLVMICSCVAVCFFVVGDSVVVELIETVVCVLVVSVMVEVWPCE